jgi:hypothetical protein
MPRHGLASVVLTLALALAGCTSVCDREFLPFNGDASTPEHTLAIVQYACKNECWRVLYDHTSEKTRDKYSYVEFRLGFPDLKAPDHAETVCELIARTEPEPSVIHSHLSDETHEFRLGLLTYNDGIKNRDLNVLLIQEPGEDEKPEWHVALQEQVIRKVSFD